MHFVSVREGFGRVIVRTCGHQKVTCEGMDHGVLWLDHDQFLKVEESLRGVSNEVAALASEEVGVKQVFV